jgi:hypothetical protein
MVDQGLLYFGWEAQAAKILDGAPAWSARVFTPTPDGFSVKLLPTAGAGFAPAEGHDPEPFVVIALLCHLNVPFICQAGVTNG